MTRGWLLANWAGYLSVVTITVAIWLVVSLVSGEWRYFWPIWMAGPWGVVLLVNTVTGLAASAPHRWHGRGRWYGWNQRHGRWHERDRRQERDG